MKAAKRLIRDAQDRIVSAMSIALNVIPHDIQSARNGLAAANTLLEQALAALGEDDPEPMVEHPRAKTVRAPRGLTGPLAG